MSTPTDTYQSYLREKFATNFVDAFADHEISLTESLQLTEDLEPLFGIASAEPQIILAALVGHAQHNYGDFRNFDLSHFDLQDYAEIDAVRFSVSEAGQNEIDRLAGVLADRPRQALYSNALAHFVENKKLSKQDLDLLLLAQASVKVDRDSTQWQALSPEQQLVAFVETEGVLQTCKQLLQRTYAAEDDNFRLGLRLLDALLAKKIPLKEVLAEKQSPQSFVSRICNDPRARAEMAPVVIQLFNAYWDQKYDPALLALNLEALEFLTLHGDELGEARMQQLARLADQRLAIAPVTKPGEAKNGELSDEGIRLLYLMQTTGMFASEPLPPESKDLLQSSAMAFVATADAQPPANEN